MTRRALVVTILIAALTLGLSAATIQPARFALQAGLAPLAAPLTSLAAQIRSIVATVREIRTLQQTTIELRSKNQSLTAQVAQLSALTSENEALRSALKFQDQQRDQQLVSAHVIARSPDSFQERFLIDRGSVDSIVVGAPVIADGFLVGVVSEVAVHQATVKLVTASDSAVAVVFVNSRAQGLLRGGLSGLVVGDVSLDAKVVSGEPLVTSSLGGQLPANIPIGTARSSQSLPSDILQEISIDSPAHLSTLELVFVGRPQERS